MACCSFQRAALSAAAPTRRQLVLICCTPLPRLGTSSVERPSNAAGGLGTLVGLSLSRRSSSSCNPLSTACRAAKDERTAPGSGGGSDNSNLLVSLGFAALWAALVAYAFVLSPNQTPTRDMLFLERLVNLKTDADVTVNQVFYALFNIMGIYPAIYACLLIPAARSENKVPAWPFVALSFGFGAFALLPYFIFWQPQRQPLQLPPAKAELEGWNRLFMKGAETVVMPALLLAGALAMWYTALSAGGKAWLDYTSLFDESRFVHATSIDFMTLTALAPFWMYNDAEARRWELKDKLLPVLSLLPVVGPATYLLLRPKTDMSAQD